MRFRLVLAILPCLLPFRSSSAPAAPGAALLLAAAIPAPAPSPTHVATTTSPATSPQLSGLLRPASSWRDASWTPAESRSRASRSRRSQTVCSPPPRRTDGDGRFTLAAHPMREEKGSAVIWFQSPDAQLYVDTSIVVRAGKTALEHHLFPECTQFLQTTAAARPTSRSRCARSPSAGWP